MKWLTLLLALLACGEARAQGVHWGDPVLVGEKTSLDSDRSEMVSEKPTPEGRAMICAAYAFNVRGDQWGTLTDEAGNVYERVTDFCEEEDTPESDDLEPDVEGRCTAIYLIKATKTELPQGGKITADTEARVAKLDLRCHSLTVTPLSIIERIMDAITGFFS